MRASEVYVSVVISAYKFDCFAYEMGGEANFLELDTIRSTFKISRPICPDFPLGILPRSTKETTLT